MSIDYSRQTGIVDPRDIVWPVHIIGLGGIGSAVALPVIKLGFTELKLYDDDRVSAPNIPNQLLCAEQDIGRLKVEVMKERLASFGFQNITIFTERVGPIHRQRLDGIVISGVDSMESRKSIWEAIKINTRVHLYIDGRIGGQHGALFHLNPSILAEIEVYESWLFSDEDAAPLPCGGEGTIMTPLAIAGYICDVLTRFVQGKPRQNLKFAFGDHVTVHEL